MDQSAIQNLDYLRELIALVRSESEMRDMERLRMIYGTGTGTGAVTAEEDR
jgi:hypothetical protein